MGDLNWTLKNNKKSSTKESLHIIEPHPSMSLSSSLIPGSSRWSLSLHFVPSSFFNRAFFCHKPGLERPFLTAATFSEETVSSSLLEIRQNSLGGLYPHHPPRPQQLHGCRRYPTMRPPGRARLVGSSSSSVCNSI